ncbi:Alpha-galactosidase-like protein [Lachnospiraceae bacterium TWA4]|nr:Alpha-galactosidase-like protein [Lachnospiraceae bacterium TWA4]
MKGLITMQYNLMSLPRPNYITITTNDSPIECRPLDNHLAINDIEFDVKPTKTGTKIFLKADLTPIKYLKFRWDVQWPNKARFLGDAWERGYGDFEWRGLSANRFMPWYFCAHGTDVSCCFGVKVRPNALCFWQVDSEGMTLFMDVRNGGCGVHLKGRSLELVHIVGMVTEEPDSFTILSEFCGLLCTDPILPPHPVYGSNNWYYAYGNSSEKEILYDCDYLMRLTKGAKNAPYMVIDDCWQEHPRYDKFNGGPWKKGNEKFPDMAGLASKIKEKGAHPGIWVRLLQNEDEVIPNEWRKSGSEFLDPTHPEALAYIKADVKRICDWGYELIKHDFSTFDLFGKWGFQMNPLMTEEANWHFHDDSITNAEVVKLLYQAIYEVCKESDTLIIGCNTIGHLGAGLMHINRTGDDTSGLEWERTRRMGINTLAFRLPQHKKFYDVDADCVGIDGKISWEFNRQWADVLAKSGSPLFVSARPDLLNEEEFEELHQIMLLASKQEIHVIPKDWEDTDCPTIWEDATNGILETYHWYEESGLHFKMHTSAGSPYLSIIK